LITKADAANQIIEFSDFQCPYCGRASQTIDLLKKKYGEDKLRIVFKHNPLTNHKDAPLAAQSSLCAGEQSKEKFWEMHDIMF